MKKLLLLLVLLAILIPAGALLLGGQLLETGIEKGGTAAIGTSTTLHSANLSILSGEVGLEDFSVANPAGFSTGSAFEVGEIAVKAEPRSFLDDTVRIDRIDIRAPIIALQVGAGGTNLGALMKNLQGETSTGGSGSDGSSGGGKKLHIGALTIDGAELHLAQSLLGGGTQTTIRLPKIDVRDFGNDMTLAQVMERVLGLIMAEAAESNLGGQLKGLLNTELGDLRGQLDQALKGAVGEAQKHVDDLKKQAEGAIGEGLGGLLGGKQEK